MYGYAGKILRVNLSNKMHSTEKLSDEELQSMLDNYYDLRGWDKTTGNPTSAKLKELGLELADLTFER